MDIEQIQCGSYKSLTKMFQDILAAVKITGRHVLSCDDPANKLVGFHMTLIQGDLQYEWKWDIHLRDLVWNAQKIPRWGTGKTFKGFTSSNGRAEIASTLSRGKMPS